MPGSLSSALITRKDGRPSLFLGMKDHFRPEGKPAPPRPRRPDVIKINMRIDEIINDDVELNEHMTIIQSDSYEGTLL